LQTFITNSINNTLGSATSTAGGSFLTAYQTLQRQVVIVAEPVSNTLLISATPQYFNELKRIIERMDAQPPQVVIQVMIADVQLNNTEEFGIEFGLQSPVLFARGGLGTPTTTNGVTNAAVPGFNFNTTAPLGNSAIVQQQTVGFQGLSNLGVGRSSTTGAGFGGFVFSAASDSFNLLIRALKAQNRVDILSRPQVQVMDNQSGFIQVGQNFPYLSTSAVTGTGIATQNIAYEPIGVTMRVTPRVNPDGKVLMRVEPTIASVSPALVSLGNGIQQPVFNVQTVQTTVLASDGETIVLGGLITKQDQRVENGYPFLKDIPYIGALFRYRSHQVQRREVLIIMTPHIIRTEADQARILAEEAARQHWCVPDIGRIHGHGLQVIEPAMQGARAVPINPGTTNGQGVPAGPPPQTYVPGPAYIDPSPLQPNDPRLTGQGQPSYPGGTSTPIINQVNPPPMQSIPLPPASGGVPLPPGTPVGVAAPQQPNSPPVTPVAAAQPGMTSLATATPYPSYQMVMPNGQVVPTPGMPAPPPPLPATAAHGYVMVGQQQPYQPNGEGTSAAEGNTYPKDREQPRAKESRKWLRPTEWSVFGR
jgi:hypothetical protein